MVAMAPPANPTDDPDDAAALARHAEALVDAIDATVAGWAARCVTSRWTQWCGAAPNPEVVEVARAVGERVRAEVAPALKALLRTDVDAQRTNPLAVLRAAVRHPTTALQQLGVPPVARDEQARRLFPDDAYDLAPGSFADIDPSVHEPGLVWGAAKAHVVLRRRRRD
jgi:hypothetical protein